MPAFVPRRRLLVATGASVMLCGCERIARLLGRDAGDDEPFLQDDELVRAPITPAAASFSGVLEARRFMSFSGCADQGTPLRWLVLSAQGKRLPIRIVTDSTLAALTQGDEGALENDSLNGEPLTPEDAPRLGVAVGDQLQLQGAYAALHFSGTMAMVPVYGICATRLR